MSEDELKSSKRILDPVERWSEVLFGLIMVLGFTSTISAVHSGRPEVRTMIVGALGCNLAWGLVDAIMYLMASLSQKGHGLMTLNAVVSARTPQDAHRVIRDGLPNLVVKCMDEAQFEQIRKGLLRIPVPARVRLNQDDFRGAISVFLLVFFSTFPVVVPFIFYPDRVRTALRCSNLIAIVMLAVTGYAYGQYSGGQKWLWAVSMVLLGASMVAITVKFGG
jgi:hypothetical protein